MVSGAISEDDTMVIVSQPIGSMKFPKKRVEKICGSLQEVYQYKLETLPENDFDERIKLARWCLEQRMEAEARGQLEAILARSPKHPQARAMIESLDQSQARMANRQRDPQVQQTGAEQVQLTSQADDRPASLDASVITGARRGMGLSDVPVIFDLPPAQAVKRLDQFTRYVHPVLQTYCARCHNERYDGAFQLVQFKTKADKTRESLRANLDATLRLVDKDNLTRSELLSSALRAHGRGPTKRPIFQGSNDRGYQILAAWVNSLQAPKGGDAVVPARFTPPLPDQGESFASQRGRINGEVDELTQPRRFVTGPVETKVLPPMRFEQGKGMVPETAVGPDAFPLPFAAGGKPKAAAPKGPPSAVRETDGESRRWSGRIARDGLEKPCPCRHKTARDSPGRCRGNDGAGSGHES